MIKTLVSAFGFIILMLTSVAFATPVPDTGMTKCYNDSVEIACPSSGQPFYGQDAQYTINPMSYTKLDGSGNALPDSAASWVTVKDNVTGLIWEMKTNLDGVQNYSDPHDADNTYTWYDSNSATNGGDAGTPGAGTDTEDFIKALNDAHYGGYSDWRMPTLNELTSIVNYSIARPGPGPTIDTGYFSNTAERAYWSSSTTYVNNTTYFAWLVYFDSGGHVRGWVKDGAINVRAVRGGQTQSAYVDNGNGTVTDTSTGLMWQQAYSPGTGTWEQALAYCEGLNLGGYTDWRLPTVNELRSLLDYSRYESMINATYFPGTVSSFYWSSTTDAEFTDRACGVGFYDGYDSGYNKYNSTYVRAVRGGQTGSLGNLVISPSKQIVQKEAGTTSFSVSTTGTWSATVTSGSWLRITSGASGTNSGTINCSFTSNTALRAATIRVTSSDTSVSPVDVTVAQQGVWANIALKVNAASNTMANKIYYRTGTSTTPTTVTLPWTEKAVYGGAADGEVKVTINNKMAGDLIIKVDILTATGGVLSVSSSWLRYDNDAGPFGTPAIILAADQQVVNGARVDKQILSTLVLKNDFTTATTITLFDFFTNLYTPAHIIFTAVMLDSALSAHPQVIGVDIQSIFFNAIDTADITTPGEWWSVTPIWLTLIQSSGLEH